MEVWWTGGDKMKKRRWEAVVRRPEFKNKENLSLPKKRKKVKFSS
jgi:hypothetical protein